MLEIHPTASGQEGAAHGGGGEQPGKGLERKEETRCDPSCQRALQEADRASNAGREVGTPPPVSSTDYAPSAASDPLAYAAHHGIPTGYGLQKLAS